MPGCNCGGDGTSYKIRRTNPDGTYNIIDVVKDVMGGAVEHASQEQQKQRLKVCSTCDHLLKGVVRMCKKCGCILAVKVKFLKSSCPLSKWESDEYT